MNDIIKEEKIENMIYEIRGKQVMLDSDLARLQAISKNKSYNLINKKQQLTIVNRKKQKAVV